MLPWLALAGLFAANDPIVSTAWLQAHSTDPQVRVICVGDRDAYDRGHIPGARLIDHMDTIGDGHRLADSKTLARLFADAGAADGAHVVLYGDSPMEVGWIYVALTSIGHDDDVSMLEGGIGLWQSEKRAVSKSATPKGTGPLTVRPAPDLLVDAAWVRAHLSSPATKVLDVRTTGEYSAGHVPGATLVLWQDLYADLKTQKLKSPDEIRALITRAGVAPGQNAVTYCAVGMRASLMFWAARAAGIPVRVYVGSWQDWSKDPANPIAR